MILVLHPILFESKTKMIFEIPPPYFLEIEILITFGSMVLESEQADITQLVMLVQIMIKMFFPQFCIFKSQTVKMICSLNDLSLMTIITNRPPVIIWIY